MYTRGKIVIILTSLALLLSTCAFGPNPSTGVVSYRHGYVYLRNLKYYGVGQLPGGWKRFKTRVRTITFYNETLGSSISTDAYCGRDVGGRSLDSLSGDILNAFDKNKVISEKDFVLNGRGAVRQLVSGELEGVKMMVDLVMVRKDECVFDFYSVSEGGISPETTDAFEIFFKGFHYE